MDKGKFFSGLFIMIGLIFAGLMLPKAVSVFRSYDRVVSVKGLCEREVKADKAIWPIVVKYAGDDMASIQSQLGSRAEELKSFLRSGGIQDSEISESISVSDKATMEYSNDRSSRYIVKQVITVCTSNVDAVLDLMSRQDDLMRFGISGNDWENPTTFSFEALNQIKPEMIEEATHNAREVALKFAADSDSKLGKIKDAEQGTFSISDRDSNTPYIKNVRVVTYVTYYLTK